MCECGGFKARRSERCNKCKRATDRLKWTDPCVSCGGVKTGRFRKCNPCRYAAQLKPCRRCGGPKPVGSPRSSYCSDECRRTCPKCKIRDRGTERDMCKPCKAEQSYLRRDRRCHRCGAHKFSDGERRNQSKWFCGKCIHLCTKCDRPRAQVPWTGKKAWCTYHLWEAQIKRYGLNAEQWEALFDAQGRRCGVCRSDNPGRRGPRFAGNPWHTDHDHVTGHVRGILCQRCNRTLGFLGDTLASVRKRSADFEKYLSLPCLFAGQLP